METIILLMLSLAVASEAQPAPSEPVPPQIGREDAPAWGVLAVVPESHQHVLVARRTPEGTLEVSCVLERDFEKKTSEEDEVKP